MGEKKDRRKVKRAVKKLLKAIDKGERNRLQRNFVSREEAQKQTNRVFEIAEALEDLKDPNADVRPPMSFRDVPEPGQSEGEGEQQ